MVNTQSNSLDTLISNYVRQNDRDHFLCSLFVPKSVRHNYLVLYAFNIEINNIIYNCSTMTALVRLKWWREKIDMVYQNKIIDNNRILCELADLIHSTAIPYSFICDYLDGYANQFSYRDISDIENIATQTTVNLIKMLFVATKKDYYNDQLSYHCGSAWHMMNSLRNILPIASLDQKTIILLIERAEYHIDQALILIKTAPSNIAKITLQVKLASLYLKHIKGNKLNVINLNTINKEAGPIMQIKMLLCYLSMCLW